MRCLSLILIIVLTFFKFLTPSICIAIFYFIFLFVYTFSSQRPPFFSPKALLLHLKRFIVNQDQLTTNSTQSDHRPAQATFCKNNVSLTPLYVIVYHSCFLFRNVSYYQI